MMEYGIANKFIGFPVLIGRKQFTQKISPLIRKYSQVIQKPRSDFQTGKYALAAILDSSEPILVIFNQENASSLKLI